MSNHQPINPNFPDLWHGGDYNAEQWPREIWDEDMAWMGKARVNTATVGVFSWVSLEPEEGVFTFDWLDELMDLMHANGVHAVLATPSAAPPAWMAHKYPEILRVGPDRVRRLHGNRVNYNWSSSLYRDKTAEMAERLALRYGKHPALALWHASNEYGGEDFSEGSRQEFIAWLQAKYEDLESLNQAYWTRFWGHTYTDWSQIEIPGEPYSETAIHGLNLDWRRFVNDQILGFYLNESGPLRRITPHIPITTNMMGTYPIIDPWKWKDHVDVFSWDSYPGFTDHPVDERDWVKVAFTHDLYRSIKQKPFLLIESTPISSNWYATMRLKRPGAHKLEAMQAVAHGSEGVMYFQWRQSRGSQEKFHGAVVTHAGGPGTRTFDEVAEVGQELSILQDLVGTTQDPEVAFIYDWENAWALIDSCGPVLGDKGYFHTCLRHYHGFWEQSIPCDVIDSDQPFDKYRVLVAPMLYMLKPGVAKRMEEFVQSGGTLVTTYLTGIVNETDLAYQRDRDWPLQDLLGIHTEELDALFPNESVPLSINLSNGPESFSATKFCDVIHLRGAEALGEYKAEFYAGNPVLTKNQLGKGQAWYIAARTEDDFLARFYAKIAQELDLKRDFEVATPDGVMAICRGNRRFLINYTDQPQSFQRDGSLITMAPFETVIELVQEPALAR